MEKQWNNSNRIGYDIDDFITQEELSANSYISSIPDTYVTQAELSSCGYLTSIPSEYITQDELSANSYLTQHQDLSAYVTKTDISNASYITMGDVSACGYLTSIPSEYITQDELSANSYLTQHQDLSAYVTKTDISNASYITMGDVSACGYLTSIPSEYITQDELSANSYLTQHQDLSSYATKSYVVDFVNEFIKEPEVVWETDGTTGLLALNTDMSASPAWQLTNLDMTPYKKIKIYTKANQKSGVTASASTTAAMILEMTLDARAAGPYGGHFIGSVISQKPNDANRLATLTCAVSADKTSFAVMRMTNLYGTGATDNTDVNGYVFKIVGFYYD